MCYSIREKKIERAIITSIKHAEYGTWATTTNHPIGFYLGDDTKFTGKVILSVEQYKYLLDQIERNFCHKCHDEGLKEAFGGH